jgi:Fe-S cluster biogenesis protein NfuA
MEKDAAFQKQIERIGELVERLENSADPSSRATAKDLLESLMALHGAGIERMLELASETGEAGTVMIAKCAKDELVSSLLLLYGLHPDDLNTRVNKALEKTRPFLDSHGAKVEAVSVSENSSVSVRLRLKVGGCGSTATSVKATLEATLQNAAPDASAIVVEEVGELTRSGFVPLAKLETGHAAVAVSSAQVAQRSGD